MGVLVVPVMAARVTSLLVAPTTAFLITISIFILQQILSSAVRIDTVAISDDADTGLEALALSTGGNAYFSLDNDTSNAITEAFLDIGEHLTTGLSIYRFCQ